MHHLVSIFSALGVLFAVTLAQDSGLTVQTQQGAVTGLLVLPTVRQFLGIPYATAGRWQAPANPPSRNATLNANQFRDSCPQLADSLEIIFAELIGSSTAPVSESDNCLNLNIWTPSTSRKQSTAVLLWIYGGSFQFGTSNTAFYNGANFVRDNDDLTIVTINYRTNIFGNPNAPQLVSSTQSQNFGFLDIEAAIKWVHDNIGGFGGDPNRITIFGQSAGSAAVDAYAYSHPSDTIVKGIITMSGTLDIILSADVTRIGVDQPNVVAWNEIAGLVGCGIIPTAQQLACMRAINSHTLEQVVIASGASFVPIVDDITIFSNTRQRAAAGNFLHVPMLGGTTAQEGDIFVVDAELATTGIVVPGVTQAEADVLTPILFTCPARTAASDRSSAGLPTWRYQYQAVFPDLQGNLNLRSYHASDIPLVFGTYNTSTLTSRPTANEIALSRFMQSAWVAFARDPANALNNAPFSWPQVKNGGNNIVLLGNSKNPTGATFTTSTLIDVGCNNIPALVQSYEGFGISVSFV